MDIAAYLTEQRAKLTKEFEALKTANAQARQQIEVLDSSIKTRAEQMCNLQGAFSQLRHLEATVPEATGPTLVAVPTPRRKRTPKPKPNGAETVTEQAHG